MEEDNSKEETIRTNIKKEEDDKPLCFGTYISENDILCGKCTRNCKPDCIKLTKIRHYP